MGIDEGDTLVKNTLHVYMALPQWTPLILLMHANSEI
jgi:hypothetical protein